MLQGRVLRLFLVSYAAIVTHGCVDLDIVSREGWGARPSLGNTTMETPVPHIFIHHTAMGECDDFASCSQMMTTIQNFHMDDRGWDDIGYNFLIGGDGRVYTGRGWNRVGAHTLGYNSNSIAFSLMGDFTNHPPSHIMIRTLLKAIAKAKYEVYVTRDYKLHGHRDAKCTECPGDAFYNIIRWWPNFEGGPLPGYRCDVT